MSQQPELSYLTFPCEFAVKAFGKLTPDFQSIVVALVSQHVDTAIEETHVTSKPSKDMNYLSVTVTIQATSKAQLDAIYGSLTSEPAVILSL
jgi:putative lipoic acid-binding regulatory protein